MQVEAERGSSINGDVSASLGATASLAELERSLRARGRPNFSLRHRLGRALWAIAWGLLASWTPKPLRLWRVFLLRLFGARIGARCDVRGSARVWRPANLVMEDSSILAEGVNCYNMDRIVIGAHAIVSQRAFLCGGTHDYSLARHPLVTRPIEIGPQAWICAEAFVGPGAVVAEGCVIGARAVLNGKTEPWSVYAGNPARRVKARTLRA